MPTPVILKSTPWTDLETVDRLSRDDIWAVSYGVLRWLHHPTTRESHAAELLANHNDNIQAFVVDELTQDPLLVSPNGRLTRRLGNALYKRYKLRRNELFSSYVNEVLEGLSFKGKIQGRLDPWLHWRAGKYGDKGSCFMNDSDSLDRYMLTASNAYAFQVTSDGKGVGRCWVVADKKRDRVFAFNVYGIQHSKMMNLLQQLLTTIGNPPLEGEWSRFTFKVIAGNVSKYMYVNHGEAYCMMAEDLDRGREKRTLVGDTCIGVNGWVAEHEYGNREFYGDKRCRFCICDKSPQYPVCDAPQEHIDNARYFRNQQAPR